ncbi:MAG TPA: hypothetical protein PK440_16480, partial [Candidatus Accumulibacter phosphatis]|nr:hypothetical protein [Candidatus Accumulibacter phosphatis]
VSAHYDESSTDEHRVIQEDVRGDDACGGAAADAAGGARSATRSSSESSTSFAFAKRFRIPFIPTPAVITRRPTGWSRGLYEASKAMQGVARG